MQTTNASQIHIAFTSALQPIKRVWVQAASVALAEFGLPMSLCSTVVLAARAGEKGIRQNVLAEEVGVNPGAMVRILDQAEQMGLVERRDSADDRRVKTIHILPAGQVQAARMEEAISALRDKLLGDMPIEEIEVATRVLRAFEERIGNFLQQERTGR